MKSLNVRIHTPDSELELIVKEEATGKQLFDKIAYTVGLREVWYFGLEYTDTSGFTSWVNFEKKLLKQNVKKDHNGIYCFRFCVRFHPENVEEIIQELTQTLFYKHVKQQILQNEIVCPPETAVLLASYAIQAKYGDSDSSSTKQHNFLTTDRLLPSTNFSSIETLEELEERILQLWFTYNGMTREQAILEYLKAAQDLKMYGVNYFEIRMKNGTDFYLGVTASGLNIYDSSDKLVPKLHFPWMEIKNVSFNGKKFTIKLISNADDFIFFSKRGRINKKILGLCMGNHNLYVRRRQPDTIEIQHIKQQNEIERKHRFIEQECLKRERLARESAEKKQLTYEENLKKMEEEMDRQHYAIHKAHQTIQQMETQLREVQLAKYELEQKELEIQKSNDRLGRPTAKIRLMQAIENHEDQLTAIRSHWHSRQHANKIISKRNDKQKSNMKKFSNFCTSCLPCKESKQEDHQSSYSSWNSYQRRLSDQKDDSSVASSLDNYEFVHNPIYKEPEELHNRIGSPKLSSKIQSIVENLNKDLDEKNYDNISKENYQNSLENSNQVQKHFVNYSGNVRRRIEQFEKMT